MAEASYLREEHPGAAGEGGDVQEELPVGVDRAQSKCKAIAVFAKQAGFRTLARDPRNMCEGVWNNSPESRLNARADRGVDLLFGSAGTPAVRETMRPQTAAPSLTSAV